MNARDAMTLSGWGPKDIISETKVKKLYHLNDADLNTLPCTNRNAFDVSYVAYRKVDVLKRVQQKKQTDPAYASTIGTKGASLDEMQAVPKGGVHKKRSKKARRTSQWVYLDEDIGYVHIDQLKDFDGRL